MLNGELLPAGVSNYLQYIFNHLLQNTSEQGWLPFWVKLHLPAEINTLEDAASLNTSLQSLTSTSSVWAEVTICGGLTTLLAKGVGFGMYKWVQRRMGCPEVEDWETEGSMDVRMRARVCGEGRAGGGQSTL